jgi:glycosyltransferase involved in cell wall biosynthesis
VEIVLFTHPEALGSVSMPKFAGMLSKGLQARGHAVDTWTPKPVFYKCPSPRALKKWLGYIDQFVIFPRECKVRLQQVAPNTLFVFADHALGPWAPMVANKPHVLHCHDFIAQKAALMPDGRSPTKFTGKMYQRWIRKGYRQAQNFVSVSNSTRQDLHRMLPDTPHISEVVYNGLNGAFSPGSVDEARRVLGGICENDLRSGYLLHVGGNQPYKNRLGVVAVYEAWRAVSGNASPLMLVGKEPDPVLRQAIKGSRYAKDIAVVTGLNDRGLVEAYRGAILLVFPSIAEGFGWPIAEAMACGTPVLTTGAAPMNEVGGDAAFYGPCLGDLSPSGVAQWAEIWAAIALRISTLGSSDRQRVVDRGLQEAKRFQTGDYLDAIESIYQRILSER